MVFVLMALVAIVGFAGLLAYLRSREAQRDAASATVSLDVDDQGVERHLADGRIESVAWTDVMEVEVITTNVGVHRDDGAIVVLAVDEVHGCLVPSRLAAEHGVIEHLSRLPGFDARRLVAALEVPPPSRTTCWERPVR